MPRDGSGVYTRPGGTTAVTNTTISSTAYNNNVADVETDLNTPRPIVAGGTAATTAAAARTNLGAIGEAPTDGQAYARKSSAWTTVDAYTKAQSDAQNVRYDAAQGLTATQQTQARSNIYAAPFDALAYSGMQINGSCDVSQERGSTVFGATVNTWTYIQDGWRLYFNSAPLALTALPAATTGALPQIPRYTGFSVSTIKASLAAGDCIIISHPIEGYRISRLGFGTSSAQPISIGFYVNTYRTGTMAVALQNGAGNRAYVVDVVINNPSTWEYKTVTIPGDVAGTWTNDNTNGMMVTFCFGAGTTFQVAAGAWLAGNVFATASTTNFMTTANGNIAITGLVVLPGVELPSANRSALIMRPYDQELLTCMRYYEQFITEVFGYQTAGAPLEVSNSFKVTKRAVPTMAIKSWTAATNAGSQGIGQVTNLGFSFSAAAVATGTMYFQGVLTSADARL